MKNQTEVKKRTLRLSEAGEAGLKYLQGVINLRTDNAIIDAYIARAETRQQTLDRFKDEVIELRAEVARLRTEKYNLCQALKPFTSEEKPS